MTEQIVKSRLTRERIADLEWEPIAMPPDEFVKVDQTVTDNGDGTFTHTLRPKGPSGSTPIR